MRAIGHDREVAMSSGINVDRTRIIAVIISTVLAAWGQIIFYQNLGTMDAYYGHEKVGTFCVAAILIGGASVTKATIRQCWEPFCSICCTMSVLWHPSRSSTTPWLADISV